MRHILLILMASLIIASCGKKAIEGALCPLVSPLATTEQWRDPQNPHAPAFYIEINNSNVECVPHPETEDMIRRIKLTITAHISQADAITQRNFSIPAFIIRLQNDQLMSRFNAQLPLDLPENLEDGQKITLPIYTVETPMEKDEKKQFQQNEFLVGFTQTPMQIEANRAARRARVLPGRNE